MAPGAKALGDPTRLAIALALDAGEPACVWIAGCDERLVSHHARSQREGKMVMYELTERGRQLLVAVSAQRVAT